MDRRGKLMLDKWQWTKHLLWYKIRARVNQVWIATYMSDYTQVRGFGSSSISFIL